MMHCDIEEGMVVSADALITLQPNVIDYGSIRKNKGPQILYIMQVRG